MQSVRQKYILKALSPKTPTRDNLFVPLFSPTESKTNPFQQAYVTICTKQAELNKTEYAAYIETEWKKHLTTAAPDIFANIFLKKIKHFAIETGLTDIPEKDKPKTLAALTSQSQLTEHILFESLKKAILEFKSDAPPSLKVVVSNIKSSLEEFLRGIGLDHRKMSSTIKLIEVSEPTGFYANYENNMTLLKTFDFLNNNSIIFNELGKLITTEKENKENQPAITSLQNNPAGVFLTAINIAIRVSATREADSTATKNLENQLQILVFSLAEQHYKNEQHNGMMATSSTTENRVRSLKFGF